MSENEGDNCKERAHTFTHTHTRSHMAHMAHRTHSRRKVTERKVGEAKSIRMEVKVKMRWKMIVA